MYVPLLGPLCHRFAIELQSNNLYTTGFLRVIYAILNASVILERNEKCLQRNEKRLERNEKRLERNEKRLERNETRLARNETRGGNLLFGGTVCLLHTIYNVVCMMSSLLWLLHFHSLAPRYVLLNVHNLLHLVEDVNTNGPLWCNSLFVFEDWNGDITDFFYGTQNVANQVISIYFSLHEKDKERPVEGFLFQYTCTCNLEL